MVTKRQPDRDGEVAPGAVAFTVTAPIDPERLDTELAGESARKPGLVFEGDLRDATEAKPVTVWVIGEVDTNDFKRAVKEHDYSETPRLLTVSNDALDSLLAKPEDEPYTDAEMQQAIRLLLRRAGSV